MLLIRVIEFSFCSNLSQATRRKWYSVWTWILTFSIYTTFHLSRKPLTIVKNVLNENCSRLIPPNNTATNNTHWCDWAPFDGENSSTLLGILDSAYLFSYAISMFFSGVIAERSRLNFYLFYGMVLSGIMTAAFGLGYTFNIHYFWYYLVVQLICGVFQSSGWPGVVTVMGNWFGKKKRGLIMGIWNSHTSLGNILGTLIATAFLNNDWSFSFIVPGIIIVVLGIIVLFFLVPEPADVGLDNPNIRQIEWTTEVRERLLEDTEQNISDEVSIIPLIDKREEKPISFMRALKIPGVIEFSLSLFFSKMVSYTLLYWLPHFIFDNTNSSATRSGEISTFYDIGGISGGILAGVLSDATNMPASTCSIMLIGALPMLFIYQKLSPNMTLMGNTLLLLPVGLLVNGPYSLITTAVSAELGTHSSLQGNAKALSTVSSIIDGTGSIGAAVGPLIAGVLSNGGNWSNVFYVMILSDALSLVLLLRLVKKEIERLF